MSAPPGGVRVAVAPRSGSFFERNRCPFAYAGMSMVDRDVEAVLGKLGPEARRDTVDARVEQRLVGPQLGSEAVERLHARGTAACLAQGGVLGDQRGDARPGGKRIDALREADPNEAGRKRVSRPVVAGKPLAGTVAANVLEHATGALNIDGCRIDVPVGGIRPLRIPGSRSRPGRVRRR